MAMRRDPVNDAVRMNVVDRVLVVTLDRPTANAIDVATSHALHGTARSGGWRSTPRCGWRS